MVVAVARWRGLAALVGLVLSYLVIVRFTLPSLLDGHSPVAVALTPRRSRSQDRGRIGSRRRREPARRRRRGKGRPGGQIPEVAEPSRKAWNPVTG
ncbi:YibE/F family protein [Parafrankia sp. CH37]|uniref:YibE/F family protein n=1 Tax=Parafrankia sp. CH37 TaxID=683308 RepID=UPI001F620F95